MSEWLTALGTAEPGVFLSFCLPALNLMRSFMGVAFGVSASCSTQYCQRGVEQLLLYIPLG